jgi:hypothetical protein
MSVERGEPGGVAARSTRSRSANRLLGASTLAGAMVGIALAAVLVVAGVLRSGADDPLEVMNALVALAVVLFPYLLVLLVPLLALDGSLTALVLRRLERSARPAHTAPRYAAVFAGLGTGLMAHVFPVILGIVRVPIAVETWVGGLALTFAILFGLGVLIAPRVLLTRGNRSRP